MPLLAGLVLAAGAGRRFGGPKALARDASGTPWISLAIELLRAAGCDEVTVVLGASAAEARALVPTGVRIVVAEDWEVGMSASLRAGLRELGGGRGGGAGAEFDDAGAGRDGGAGAGFDDAGAGRDGGAGADAALLTLVDLPGLPVSVAERLLDGGFGPAGAAGPATLRQAVFGGRPGHPVLIGRDHWAALAETAQGDRGARPYLVAHGVVEVECGDLAGGEDIDSR